MYGDYILRLIVAGVLGGIIGWDREYRAKEAGLRTHFSGYWERLANDCISTWVFRCLG